jgi:hypothetical protein
MRRDAQNKPQSAEQIAKALPSDAWCEVAWREGVDKTLNSRFAGLRVRPAHRDYWRSQPHAEEWLLVEWPEDENAPTKSWLSTLPKDTTIATLVETAKLRWRIERDYQELKQELGLDHYEGRGWRALGPCAREIRVRQRLALVGKHEHDVAGVGLRLEQPHPQPAAIDRLGVLTAFQRVAGSAIAKAPFCEAPSRAAISRSSRLPAPRSHRPDAPASS